MKLAKNTPLDHVMCSFDVTIAILQRVKAAIVLLPKQIAASTEYNARCVQSGGAALQCMIHICICLYYQIVIAIAINQYHLYNYLLCILYITINII